MSSGTSVRLEPYEVALMRGGTRSAVTVAVLALHLRGLVDAGRQGRIRTTGAAGAGAGAEDGAAGNSGDDLPPLPTAVYAALQRPANIAELETAPGVREALSELRAGLVAARMLRSLPPRRTRAARHALRALHAGHPPPTDRKALAPDDVLIAVALYGEPALSVLAARFALRAGLTARAEVADKGFHRNAPRGGGTGGGSYSSCGSGSSGWD
ncbi:TIGR04222 domain-containing membrane protein [Streptomyces sp. NPDC006872]|uniref:TIGR04222 domain-containing membrane protein n=1 Tax=Streptomyces sp. NPDC006872 TaxID=3155720 RepID=UPI0033F3FF75